MMKMKGKFYESNISLMILNNLGENYIYLLGIILIGYGFFILNKHS